MRRIAFFCIPAHGHINPMLPVARELVKRGNEVRFYSFSEFEQKIKETGAEFISCDKFLPKLKTTEEKRLREVSSTEMIVQDLRITRMMDDFLNQEYSSFKPDIVYSDSVCFWGKLSARKHNVPLVVSTSTFAFNEHSAKYLKSSFKEAFDMIFGISKIKKELKELLKCGYKIKDPLDLIKNEDKTVTVVYTTKSFQPASETFNDRFSFVGPSIETALKPEKTKNRPLIYISMGTVINYQPEFYQNCIKALKDLDIDVVISVGQQIDSHHFKNLPENVKVFSSVNQLEVLSKADAFITHAGMNSVSEAIYFDTPMILNPQTSEERAVSKRTEEIGAGIRLSKGTSIDIRNSVLEILKNRTYSESVKKFGFEFRSSIGAFGAADLIESYTH